MEASEIAAAAVGMQAAQTQASMQASMAKMAQQADQLLVDMLAQSVHATKMQAASANQAKGGIVA